MLRDVQIVTDRIATEVKETLKLDKTWPLEWTANFDDYRSAQQSNGSDCAAFTFMNASLFSFRRTEFKVLHTGRSTAWRTAITMSIDIKALLVDVPSYPHPAPIHFPYEGFNHTTASSLRLLLWYTAPTQCFVPLGTFFVKRRFFDALLNPFVTVAYYFLHRFTAVEYNRLIACAANDTSAGQRFQAARRIDKPSHQHQRNGKHPTESVSAVTDREYALVVVVELRVRS
eukprot:IDg8480t1